MVGAVHLGGPTHKVMASRLKRLAVLVGPDVLRQVTSLLEDRIGVPVLGLLGQPITAFQHQDFQPCRGQHTRQRSPASTAADDHNIEMITIAHLQLIGLRHW